MIGVIGYLSVLALDRSMDAVGEIDAATQQNAALVEQAAAAAESLETQAAKLGELVGVFRLGQEAESSGRHATSVRAGSTCKALPQAAVRPLAPARPTAAGARRDWAEF